MAAILCEKRKNRRDQTVLRILEYRSLDSLAVIPEAIDAMAVTELAPYVFSAAFHEDEPEVGERFWWTEEPGDLEAPPLRGSRLVELHLPPTLEKIGAYGFYNCENLEKLEFHSSTLDWGHGVFTGCCGIKSLRVHVEEERKSCLKEVLSEIRQTLLVEYEAEGTARLIFPEFFEDMVENTPARIIVTETHGCGKQYRNAFVNTRFQFQEYDRLFPYVVAQESEELALFLALMRVMYPYGLSAEAGERYLEYLNGHKEAAACLAVRTGGIRELSWLTDHLSYDFSGFTSALKLAQKGGKAWAVSFLMEKSRIKAQPGRRRFTL